MREGIVVVYMDDLIISLDDIKNDVGSSKKYSRLRAGELD